MPIPRPAKGLKWLFSQTATYDLVIAAFASVIGFSSAANYEAQGNTDSRSSFEAAPSAS